MGYSLVNVGTAVNGTSVTPGDPAGRAKGQLLLLAAFLRNNADSFGAVSGWTPLQPGVNDTWDALFGRIATGDAGDNPPTMASVGGNQIACQIAAFSGSVYPD